MQKSKEGKEGAEDGLAKLNYSAILKFGGNHSMLQSLDPPLKAS